MNPLLRVILPLWLLIVPSWAAAFVVLGEQAFLSSYTLSALVESLYTRGDGSHPDNWLVRGYYGGGFFWEDVSFQFERGGVGAYPILLNGGNYLSVTAPLDPAISAAPLAIYTNRGFFGIVPDAADDRFYPLPGVTEINGIYSGAVMPVPEPHTWGMTILGLGVVGLAARRRRASTPARAARGQELRTDVLFGGSRRGRTRSRNAYARA